MPESGEHSRAGRSDMWGGTPNMRFSRILKKDGKLAGKAFSTL